MDTKGAKPALTWSGCVVLPAKASGQRRSGIADGGFITTNFKDPADKDAFQHMTEMKVTGEVLEWHPQKGWSTLPDSAMSGANGLALHPGRQVALRGRLAGQERHALGEGRVGLGEEGIDFHRHPYRQPALDARRLAARWRPGRQHARGVPVPGAGMSRGIGGNSIDVATGKASRLAAYPGSDAFEGGTTALRVGNEVWFGSFKGTRIARVPLPKKDGGPHSPGG